MFLSKIQSPVGLMLFSGAILVILIIFIFNKPVQKEGFKGSWIISEKELHKQKIDEENKRHAKALKSGQQHVSSNKAKNELRGAITSNPDFINEIGKVLDDEVISNTIDKTLKSKPVLNKVHDIIATPRITNQIENIIRKEPSYKKIQSLENSVKNVKQNIKKTLNNNMASIQKDIKKNIRAVQNNVQKKVEKAIKKVEVQKTKEVAKIIPKQTPYEKVLGAHNKLSEQNTNLAELRRRDLAEISVLRKQIEKVEDAQNVNDKEFQNLAAKSYAISLAQTKAEKELKESQSLFKTLVNQNLRESGKLTEIKSNAQKAKKTCDEYTKEVRRLSIRIESETAEKVSAEGNISMLKEQLKAASKNESLATIIKGQIETLEKQKLSLENSTKSLKENLEKEVKKESNMLAGIKKMEAEIINLERNSVKLGKKIEEADAKHKTGTSAIRTLNKEIVAAKDSIAVRKSTQRLLENELSNLNNQYKKKAATETNSEKQLRELEKNSNNNKKTITELQVVVKSLQVKPKDHPIGNWDFTTGSLKDKNNKFQSETVGNIPIEKYLGRTAALFREQSHIKITGSINTNDFKSITMMIYVNSNPGPWPRIWEFTNSDLGGSWCADSIFGVLSPSNNIGFYSMKNCAGPAIWSNKGNLPLASWQHLSFVYNDKMDEMTLYVNGSKVAHWTESNNKKLQNKTFRNLYIMQCVERFNKNAAVAWFRIFDYSLSGEQIKKDMNNEWR